MRFAIVGAGAIGGFVGAMLARSGEDVALIARGPHLKAIQERGLRVTGSIGEFEVKVRASDDPATIGAADVVFITLKAHSLPQMAPRLSPLIGANTTILTGQNGIPWWYFYRHGGDWEGAHLESVDPGGVIEKHIDSARVVGSVIYPSAIVTEPGVIEHIEGTRFSIGEPDGAKSDRCKAISEAFIKAGLRCPIRSNIRHEIWIKVMGNMAYNPISALTRATLIEIVQFPETRAVAAEIMREADEVARRLGIEMGVSIEQRLAGAEKVGHHKTSMLQDVEAGRPIEIEAIVGAVVELGTKLGVEMPYTTTVYACAKLLGRTAG
jgi:2-dehydropantoate 2-reductase